MELADRTASTLGKRLIVLAALIVVLLMPTAGVSQDESMAEIVEALQTRVDSLSNKVYLERGRKIYFRACASCHGIRGDGSGPAARGFDPAPRNFRRGVYKFRTTISGALPLDEDLEHTVREGVFEPNLASIAAGRQLYIEQECDTCHGENGEGDGPKADELVDDWDVPIRPGDLTRPYFANGKRDQDIYRVFTSALNGTPMPAFDDLSDEQRWQLVDYVQSLEQKQGFVYWLFRENPNQVRRPEPD